MDGGQAKGSGGARAALSAATLDKRLNLRRRAREDGGRDYPAADAIELSTAEQEVLQVAGAERARLDQARLAAQSEIERRLRAAAPGPQDFSGPALDARLSLKQVAGRLEHDWAEAAGRAHEARAHLDAFKREHNLRRGAHYPRSPIMQTGFLLCAALFEAMFSAALFAEDDARGLLGGAITAVGLSGANVTLGFLCGFLGLRYLQHTRWPIKTGGAIAFGALTLLALMLNLFAADWRDRMAELSSTLPERGSDASFQLWSLLQLESPQAIILLMLGAGVWVFATLKGYSGFDDPYPDYGKMDRAAEDASAELSDLRNESRLLLEGPVDAARETLAARFDDMRGAFDAMSKVFDAGALQMQSLDAEARALDDAASSAIHLYRQENTAARSEPAPSYFSVAPPAAGAALDPLTQSAAMLDEARARLNTAQTQKGEALAQLLADLDAVTARLDAAPLT